MNFLSVGDLHIRVKYIMDMQPTLDKIIEIISHTADKYKFVVILGDVFDKHERLHVQELITFDTFIKKLIDIVSVKIFILVGNHDRPKNTCFLTNEHGLNAYKNYKNIIIVDNLVEHEITVDDVNYKFLFVPYVQTGRFTEATNGYDLNAYNCIFTHQEFKGVSLGKIKSKKGDDVNITTTHIINGHVHNYERCGRIICVGSVHQIAFNETQDKTISEFTLDKDNILSEIRHDCNPVKSITMIIPKSDLSIEMISNLLIGNENIYKLKIDAGRDELLHLIHTFKDVHRIKFHLMGSDSRSKSVINVNTQNRHIRQSFLGCLNDLLSENPPMKEVFEDTFGKIQLA